LSTAHFARKITEIQYNLLLDINIEPQMSVEDFGDNKKA
jgi:hypothetical protein